MSGKAELIGKYAADFDKIIDTVHASASPTDPITWDLPSGWKRTEGGGSGFAKRYATITSPAGDAEIAVSMASGSVVGNAKRWCRQLWGEQKAEELTPVSVEQYMRRQVVKGRLIFRFDMAGPKDPNTAAPMMANPHGGH